MLNFDRSHDEDTNKGGIVSHQQRIIAHSGAVLSVSFKTDGAFFSSSEDGTCRLWTKKQDRNPSRKVSEWENCATYNFLGHKVPIFQVKAAPESNLFSTSSNDNTVQVWSVEHNTPLRLLENETPVSMLTWHHDSNCISVGCKYGSVAIWDLRCPKPCMKIEIQQSNASTHVFSRQMNVTSITHDNYFSCYMAVGGANGSVSLYDLKMGPSRSLYVMNTNKLNPIWCLEFSEDSTWLAAASQNGIVNIWRTCSSTCEHEQKLTKSMEEFDTECYLSPSSSLYCIRFHSNKNGWNNTDIHNLILATGASYDSPD